MRINNNPTLGYSLKEICPREPAVIIEIEKLKSFKKDCIETNLWCSFELDFMLELPFKPKWIKIYASMVVDAILNMN